VRERFAGLVEEPRPGLRRGHMPGAVNLPFTELLDDHGRLRPADDLAAIVSDRVGAPERLVFSCGSGVTACVLALGAELAGYRDLAVYDGSWSEWGLPSDLPVVGP
jgi:thiosulfate/3-mercaptopyruvate sulfurtransferase